MIQDVKDLIQREASAVLAIPINDSFEAAVRLIHLHVHQRHGKLITSGMGKAGQIALNMATTFSSTGTPSVYLHPSEAQHGDLGVIQPNDVMLVISNSGKTREICELMDLARNLNPDMPIIVLTGNGDSPLAQAGTLCLLTGNPQEVCTLGLTPTTSTTVMTVIGDVLVVLLMKLIGFSNADYAKRHHGGYLGQKSRSQAGL